MDVNCILELVDLCTTNLYFHFEENFYKQKFGMAMGNPLSPVLANLFLEHIESDILPTYDNVKPSFWYRYVDDILCLVDNDFDLTDFLSFINNLYPSLNFTFEWESDGKISFLDVLIHNYHDHLKFSVFRKKNQC